MKSNLISIPIFSKMKMALLAFISATALISCSSEKSNVEPIVDGQTTVKINVGEIAFEGISDISNKASGKNNVSEANLTQTNTIELDNGFLMVASLTAEIPAVGKTGTPESATGDNKAAVVQNQMAPGVKYKIIAYNSAGVYVQERDYIRGQENSTADFMLDGGATYTFIIYSINTTGTVPAPTFAIPANKTLATTSVSVAGTADFLYASKSMTLVGGATNNIDVVLKHKFSQITTTVDATQTGYNITAISSNINTHSPNANIALSDGTITRSGTTTTSAVSFATLGGLTTTSAPTIVNAATNSSTSYTISSITVGQLTQTGIVAFNNLNITPGVKYNMKVNIVPDDIYLTKDGLQAARINGRIWMLHNVGANYTTDPNQTPITSALHGNYYQWGRITSVGGPTSTTVSNWNASNNPAGTEWNLQNGTSNQSEKGPADPCPTGFRIPGNVEMQTLLDNTIASNIGTFTAGSTQYGSAKILTSKRNSAVKLVFPAQGYFGAAGNGAPYSPTGLANRGSNGYYWTSYRGANNINTQLNITSSAITLSNRGNNPSNFVVSHNVRCIGEE